MASDTKEVKRKEDSERTSVQAPSSIKVGDTGKKSMRGPPETKETKVPIEPYDRVKHYGHTPTKADREKLGIDGDPDLVVDHDPPLVKRYYEGDPHMGGKKGLEMTEAERKESAKKGLKVQPVEESRAQGGEMSAYAKEQKEKLERE